MVYGARVNFQHFVGKIPIFPPKSSFSAIFTSKCFSVPKLGSFGAPGLPEALERPSGQACGALELSEVTNALATVAKPRTGLWARHEVFRSCRKLQTPWQLYVKRIVHSVYMVYSIPLHVMHFAVRIVPYMHALYILVLYILVIARIQQKEQNQQGRGLHAAWAVRPRRDGCRCGAAMDC